MGFEIHPVFRQTPQDGAVVSIDTWQAFSDLGGQRVGSFDFKPDLREWKDVNRVAHSIVRGYRWEVSLVFEIMTMLDSAYLYDIVNRLGKKTWATELSLDAGGVYYPVVLSRFTGPKPLASRPFVGGNYQLNLQAADLVDEIPYLAGMAPDLPELSGLALPAAGPQWKWRFFTVQGVGGTADITYQCLYGPNEGWTWVPFVSGN